MEERFYQLLTFYNPASAIRFVYDELDLILDIYKIETSQTLGQLIYILTHVSHMLPQESIVRQQLPFILFTFSNVIIPAHILKQMETEIPWSTFMGWTIAMFKQHVSERLRELTHYEQIFTNKHVVILPFDTIETIKRRNNAIYNHFSKKSLHAV